MSEVKPIKWGSPSDDDVAEAIRLCDGNISAAARHLGVSRRTVYDRIHKNPALKETLMEAREVNLDELEDTLYDMAKNGNITALIFALKTQGRERGYSEKHYVETTLKGGVSVKRDPEEDAKHVAEVLAKMEELGGDTEED